jgi:hypothetical protein
MVVTDRQRGLPKGKGVVRTAAYHADTANCRHCLRASRICGLDRLLGLSTFPNNRTFVLNASSYPRTCSDPERDRY